MIRVLYTFCIQLYKGATYIAAIFNQKAKKRIEGIKTSKVELEDFIRSNQKELVFLHCASQGEHEQAKPLIRWILEKTDVAIILSFFSPSGYENADYLNNDRVLKIYLPFDTPKGISKLLSIIRPKTAILIKNEWWWNLIYKLKELTIPAYLVSATIRRHHYFIKYPFCFFAEGMRSFSTIFVIDKESEKIISTISSSNVHCVRDTRIDQVNYIKRRIKTKLGSTRDLQLKPVIIYGSIWEQDLKSIQVMIDQFPNHIHLIYPHLLNEEALQAIQSSIHNSKIVQHAKEATVGVNIISSMGELKYAYQLADIAYIGGGFGIGIHNILEAAVYQIPTLFGPRHQKSNEALFLLEQKAVFTFENEKELRYLCNEMSKESNRKEIETKLKAYFSTDKSGTGFICRKIFQKIELNV